MSEEPNKVDTSGLLDDEEKNLKQLVCERCSSKVLPPRTGIFQEQEFKLAPMMKKNETSDPDKFETLSQFYKVTDMYEFDNVGFTKEVDGVKYLCCADCEIGPIGYHKDGLSLVALARVKHL